MLTCVIQAHYHSSNSQPGAPFLARSSREKACPELVEGWGLGISALGHTPAP